MKTILKDPCPYCGGQVVRHHGARETISGPPEEDEVYCKGCGKAGWELDIVWDAIAARDAEWLAAVDERIDVYTNPFISDVLRVSWGHRAKALEELKARMTGGGE